MTTICYHACCVDGTRMSVVAISPWTTPPPGPVPLLQSIFSENIILSGLGFCCLLTTLGSFHRSWSIICSSTAHTLSFALTLLYAPRALTIDHSHCSLDFFSLEAFSSWTVPYAVFVWIYCKRLINSTLIEWMNFSFQFSNSSHFGCVWSCLPSLQKVQFDFTSHDIQHKYKDNL